jgi:hypothetical protein
MDKEEKQRTLLQNNAIHLFCKKLADELNGKGYYMQLVLKPTYELRWDTKTVKEHLFKPIEKALLNKTSTTELNTAEVTKVHEQLMIALQEKLTELDYIDFPSQEQTESYLKSYEK